MIEKTEAIALRVSPFAQTSPVVSWLTPARGKIATLSKGACRPKSPLLGQYDAFYTCEILYYQAARADLHVLKECSPLDARPRFRADWRAAFSASYLCGLVSSVSLPHHRQPEIYRLLRIILDFLCRHGGSHQAVLWTELELAHALGFAPRLRACATCGRSLGQADSARFSIARWGLLCARCARHENNGIALTADAVSILRAWQAAPSPHAARNTKLSPPQAAQLRDLLGLFLNYHVHPRIIGESRRITFQMLRHTAANS